MAIYHIVRKGEDGWYRNWTQEIFNYSKYMITNTTKYGESFTPFTAREWYEENKKYLKGFSMDEAIDQFYVEKEYYSKQLKSTTSTGTLTILANGEINQTGRVTGSILLEKEISRLQGSVKSANIVNVDKVNKAKLAAEEQYSLDKVAGNALTKSLNSFKQIGIGFIDGAQLRADNAFNTPYDFINWLTIGVSDGLISSSMQRADTAFNSAYDFINWLTIGTPDMLKGTFAPDEAFSKEHWINSFAAATLTIAILKPFIANSNVKSASTTTTAGRVDITDLTRQSVDDKLSRYLLNMDHPVGGSKAKWFKEALGFTQDNMEDLAKQIAFDSSKAVQTGITEYGIKLNQTISITGANGKVIDVTFAWMKSAEDGVVRLVTSIPTKK